MAAVVLGELMLMRRLAALVVGCTAAAASMVATPAAVAAPTEAIESWTIAGIDVPHGAVGYAPVQDQILVGISGTVPVLGNHLVELDPTDGSIGRSVFVGSGPNRIVVSDDGSRAYVGLGGSPRVTEVDLASFTVTREISLGLDTSGEPVYAQDIQVQPGNPSLIAVALRSLTHSPAHEGVAAYDSGVRLASITPDHTGPSEIVFGASPTTLYGASGSAVWTMNVGPGGVERTLQKAATTSGDLAWTGTALLSGSGTEVDPATGSILGSYGRTGVVVQAPAQERVFIFGGSTLSRHLTSTYAADGSRFLPATFSVSDRAVDAGSRIAATDGDTVFLMGPGASAAGFDLPVPPASALASGSGAVTDLRASALAADPAGDVVYAAVPTAAPTHANEVVELDPATGAVGRTLFVGTDPDLLQVSDDGSLLVVGHDDSNRVTEVDLTTFTVRRTVFLFEDGGDPAFARTVAMTPGDPGRYAISLLKPGQSPSHEGVVVVDDGIILPVRTPGHTGPTTLAYAGTPPGLSGYNGGTSSFGWYSIAVSDTGAVARVTGSQLVSSFNQILYGHGERIYSSGGTIIDPEQPRRVGSVASPGGAIPVFVDNLNRVLYVGGSQIIESDIEQFWPVRTHTGRFTGSVVAAAGTEDRVLIATDDGRITSLGIRTGPGLAEAPTSVAAEREDQQVTLSWAPPLSDGGSAITGYRVYVDGVQTGGTLDALVTSYAAAGLTNGTSYAFQVAAVNAEGEGEKSAVVNAAPRTVPGLPTGVQTSPGPSRVVVTWAAPVTDGGSQVTGYRVYRDGVQQGTTTSASTFSRTVTGLTNGTAYEFQVSAVNAAGEGVATDPITATPDSTTSVPDAPATPTAVPGDERVSLEWAAPASDGGSPLTGYRVYVDGSQEGGTLSLSTLALSVTRLVNDRTYDFQVSALNTVGESALSGVAATFVDVSVEHPFFADIEWMAAEGISTGFPGALFKPGQSVTRQSMSAFLYRLAGSPAFEDPSAASFSDVPVGHSFFTEVEWMVDEGIAAGFAGNRFKPGATVTRQAMAAFLHRFANGPGVQL